MWHLSPNEYPVFVHLHIKWHRTNRFSFIQYSKSDFQSRTNTFISDVWHRLGRNSYFLNNKSLFNDSILEESEMKSYLFCFSKVLISNFSEIYLSFLLDLLLCHHVIVYYLVSCCFIDIKNKSENLKRSSTRKQRNENDFIVVIGSRLLVVQLMLLSHLISVSFSLSGMFFIYHFSSVSLKSNRIVYYRNEKKKIKRNWEKTTELEASTTKAHGKKIVCVEGKREKYWRNTKMTSMWMWLQKYINESNLPDRFSCSKQLSSSFMIKCMVRWKCENHMGNRNTTNSWD